MSGAGAICILLLLGTVLGAAAAMDLHVSPKGRDTWSGRRATPRADGTDGPLATLAAARDAARALRKGGTEGPFRILVHEGRYFLTSPLELGPEDSGLTVEAATGKRPLLLGGRRVTGWMRDGEHFWSAPVPGAETGAWDFRLLLVNGKPRPRARLPETGTFEHLTDFDVPWMSTTGGGWKRKPTEAELTTMRYKPGDLGAWLEPRNAEVTVYHMWDESVVGVKSHDPATQTLHFSTPAGHPPGAFGVHKFVVWNVREGMKAPGQWYLDRKAGRVVYWPLPGESMDRVEVLAPTMESVVTLRGTPSAPVREVTIRGLELSLTTTPLRAGGFGAGGFAGAVDLKGTRDCRLEALSIHGVAGQGVGADDSQGLKVAGCELTETGACGIRTHADDSLYEDNHVHHVGFLYPSAIALWAGGRRAVIRHNEVHDTPYTAISGADDGSLVEANLVYRAMQVLHDGGGIYLGGAKNVTVRGNVIRDIVDTGGYGASAYYLDEQADDYVVEGNLAVNVAMPCHNHMAHRNVIRNNVFVVKGDARIDFPRCEGYRFEGNVVYATGRILFQAPDKGVAAMPNNVLFSQAGRVEMQLLQDYAGQEPRPLQPTEGTVLADPLFRNLDKGDYGFASDSPALKLGIPELRVSGAGRRKGGSLGR